MKKILFAAPHHFTGTIKVGGYQYAREFSKREWEVYYFSQPLSILSICFGADKKNIKERVKIYKQQGVYSEGVWSYVPLTLVPHHNNIMFLNNKLFLDNYYKFIFPPLKSIIRHKNIGAVDLLWIDYSSQSFWPKIIKYKKLIYRIFDNFSSFKNISKATIASHFELMHRADVILFSSKLLIDKQENKKFKDKIIYCPNGVDLSNFQKETYPVPKEYQILKNKPIALYVGAVDLWFDIDLLVNIGRQYPEINFVIVGPQNIIIPNNIGNNIFFLGKKDYKEIPSFIFHCDFGIVPFQRNDLVDFISPIKIYEFLALGKPVISTSWKELREINMPIFLANDQAEFISLINNLKQKRFIAIKEDLVSFARNNTWESRYDLIMGKIGELKDLTLKNG